MKIVEKIFSANKNNTYPYTYQAVINILGEDDSIKMSYFADTICGLVEFLKKRQEDPGLTEIFEIYQGKQTTIPSQCYLGGDGHWFSRQELCHPMSSRYGEPGSEGSCPFRDRSYAVI